MQRMVDKLLNNQNENVSDKDTKLDVLAILSNVSQCDHSGAKLAVQHVLTSVSEWFDDYLQNEEGTGCMDEDEVQIDEEGKIIDSEPKSKEDKVHPYIEWYTKFQPSIKMGVIEDEANRKRLSKLLRVKTSKSDGKFVSFEDYVGGMKEWQKDVYFIAGPEQKELEKSPFMDKFNEKDLEVIYFTEAADE